MSENLQEKQACIPLSVNASFLNQDCKLPYGLAPEHILNAMTDFIDFLQFINT